VVITILLAACNFAPVYQSPSAPVPEAWPQGAAYPAASDDATLVSWDAFYLDSDLRRLIQLGLENNRDLRQAGLRVEAFRALNRIQHAATLPEVSAGASEQRQRLPGDLSPTGSAGVQAQYAVGGTISYELDFFGKLRNLDQASLESYLASEQGHQSARLALVAAIADSYLAWRTDQNRYALETATLENFEHSLRLVESNEQAGLATALAVRQARSLVLQGQTRIVAFQRQVANDVNALTALLGTPMPANLSSSRDIEGVVATGVPVGLPSDLLLRRPDIRAVEHALRASNANIGAARAAFFPSISLTAGAGTASSSLDSLFGGGSGTWSFLPSITVPIFNGGRLKANQEYAEISKDIEVARYEGTIQQAFREVADGLAARGTFVTQLKGQQEQVRNAQEYLSFAQQRFDQGLDGYNAVLDAQRTLLDVRQELLTTQFQQLTAEVDLFRALGGAWDAGLRPGTGRDAVAARP
jgi:multidrug efflux system outer membrane protein